MAESHVVTGLAAKRAELAGLIAHHQKEIERLGGDLRHLDAAIKIIAPDTDLRSMRVKAFRRRNSYFKPGDAPRTLLDILRRGAQPLSSRELAEAVLAARGMQASDERIDAVQKSILATLKRLEARSLVQVASVGKGGTRAWRIA